MLVAGDATGLEQTGCKSVAGVTAWCHTQAMLLPAAPGMAVWPAAMIVWGPGFRSAAHRHHCVQLVMTLRGDMRVRGGRDKRWMKCGAVLVRPDAVHELDAPGAMVVIGFIDAESDVGVALCDRISGDMMC